MNDFEQSQATAETLSARVEERAIGPCRVLMLRTPVEGVVSWQGSFVSNPDVAAGDALVQSMAVRMLDKGTRRRDRFAVAEALEDRGAQIQFSSDPLRVAFQGRALRRDVPAVLEILAEQLREPLFDPDEFIKTRAQYQAVLQRGLESTASQAVVALSQLLYDVAHPNHHPPTEEALARLDALAVEQVRAYHARHFGACALLLVFVGDVDAEATAQAVAEAFGDWSAHGAPPAFMAEATPRPPARRTVLMPDKNNLDVRLGHTLPLRRSHPHFIPLYLGNYILGGNFSARLMTTVRDEMGLTYGIHARPVGVAAEYEGHWQVGVTLSRENLEAGLRATRAVVDRFVEDGPTPDELATKKTTITGTFQVGLATTGRLAATLHRHAIQGFGVTYLDRFPEEVEAATLEDVREAVQTYFKPSSFQTALAGTLPDGEADLPTP